MTGFARRPVRASYRLQLTREFGFKDALAQVDYLAALGISHLYLSPILTARPGSTHGYDVVDPTRLNPELGAEADFAALAQAVREQGMGLIVDIVPNHMGIGADNPWWMDVLAHGPASRFAGFFDIDWAAGGGKLILPVLGEPFGEAVAAGRISLERLEGSGQLEFRYFGQRFPLAPGTGPDLAAGEAAIGELLERQPYRLAWWRIANDMVNYRRFFDINDLAGIRVERPEVFEATHAKILALIGEGKIDGLRVDHIDGLLDPKAYLVRLREACREAGTEPYIVVEKILAEGERLPDSWPVEGTTGYDDLNLLTRVFMDPRGEAPLDRAYRALTGDLQSFDAVLAESKRQIVGRNLASEVSRAARAASSLAARGWSSRDFTEAALRRALKRVLVRLPLYRTYVDSEGISPADRETLDGAVAAARRDGPPGEESIYRFLAGLLAGEGGPEALAIARIFQQISGPAMAKGLEDTAFYRYPRCLVLNEVGGDPRRFAVDAGTFHRRVAQRRPATMIAATTHDTKRGEDARARLICLSSAPEWWRASVERWRSLNADAPALHPVDDYAFYQSLLGAWPTEPASTDGAGLADLAGRLKEAMLKAVREGKQRSSWIDPDAGYEQTLRDFIDAVLAPGHPFVADFHGAMKLAARWGAFTGLAQTLIRCTMPGVPDIYRGAERWELSLVDPDNRRLPDFARLRAGLADAGGGSPAWQDGRIKQLLLCAILAARKERPALFAEGVYRPLFAEGRLADHVLAFAREDGQGAVALSVAGRFWPRLLPHPDGRAEWANTAIALPPGDYVDVLAGQPRRVDAMPVPLAELLGDRPACFLVGVSEQSRGNQSRKSPFRG